MKKIYLQPQTAIYTVMIDQHLLSASQFTEDGDGNLTGFSVNTDTEASGASLSRGGGLWDDEE